MLAFVEGHTLVLRLVIKGVAGPHPDHVANLIQDQDPDLLYQIRSMTHT